MSKSRTILIVSDIHYACDAEKQRRGHEARIIANPLLRGAVKVYRHHVWLRDPFAHNHLLDEFMARADSPELVVTNGDYSCDTEFIGVCDEAAFESARQCLTKLRARFEPRLQSVIGDHELGKMSLFGNEKQELIVASGKCEIRTERPRMRQRAFRSNRRPLTVRFRRAKDTTGL